MKKLLAMFLALTMVFTLFPVSALAEGDAEGEPSAEEVTQIAEEPQTEPEKTPEETTDIPQENTGDTPEEATNVPQEEPEKNAEKTPEPEEAAEEILEETLEAGAELYAASEEASIEEQLRAAIANSESEFSITGDCVLSADLTLPSGFFLHVDDGTLTIPDGVTLTVVTGSFFASYSAVLIQSGGKFANNGTLNAVEGGSITVEAGGTMDNNGYFTVGDGGSFHNKGTYTLGGGGNLWFTMSAGDTGKSDWNTDLTGVDRKGVILQCQASGEAELRALFDEAENVKRTWCSVTEAASITLTADLTIPKNGTLAISGELTVPQGITLTNNGNMAVNGSLIVESGAKLVNNQSFTAEPATKVSMAGTFENGGWAYAHAKSWNCTGTFVDNGGSFTLFADAATVDELEAALQSATCVRMKADITLDRSITIPNGVQLDIEYGVKLTVPASYTITNNGTILVYGTLEINGTYSEGNILVMSSGTLIPETIPHQKENVLVEQITVIGPDTVEPGSSVWYGAEILPTNAWESWLMWSIVSGGDLASITENGNLTAGDAGGEVTIRATATDGSEVYGEKTVTIEGTALSIEERIRAAIANGKNEYRIASDCELSADITIPADFVLYVEKGTLTVPNGVTLTIAEDGCLASISNTVVQSGGKIVNNGTINSCYNGDVTIENGGTLENTSVVSVYSGGTFHNSGTYTPGDNGFMYFDMSESDLSTGLTGVDLSLVVLRCWSGNEADIRSLFAQAKNAKRIIGGISEEESITLTADLTVPENGSFSINGELIVPQGVTLTNNGAMTVNRGRLVIESGAKLVNTNGFRAINGAQLSVAGTFENTGWGEIDAKGWTCTGTLVDDEDGISLFAYAATAEEIEAVFQSGATLVRVSSDITLDRSITVPKNSEILIESGGKLTVPASYALTCYGTVIVVGTLEVSGTYEGGKVQVYQDATLTGDNIPHQKQGVLAEQITITGADSVQPGGSAQYSVEILPDNAWETEVEWSIVSGGGLAEIDIYGNLTVGDTAGTVTIRATAYDGSEVYGEKTVTIGEATLTIEDELRAAIASGKDTFTITGDCTLSRDLLVPDYFVLRQEEGTLTVPSGVTLTVTAEAFFRAAADVVIQSGGKLVNYGTTHSRTNGSITVETGGTAENNGWIAVLEGGGFHNNGTYTPGEDSRLLINVSKCNLETALTGVDRSLVTLQLEASTEAELQALFAEAGNAREVEGYILQGASVTLTGDLTIPANGSLYIYGTLTAAQGATLTNNGEIRISRSSSSLIIASGAKIVNNNAFGAEDGAQLTVAGTFENTSWASARANGWNCTGELVNSGTFLLFAEAVTAAELEAALRSGVDGATANIVEIMADITLDRSITVPENVQLNIFNTMLTVPAPYTLTNEGEITVAGTLQVSGTYSGNPVNLLAGGTLIPDDIPHRRMDVSVEQITITGADSIQPGGHTRYSATVLPEDATDWRVEWSIVSGEDLATMLDDGFLLAGASTGEVTIRATAMDGSGVYGEKTVKLEGDYVSGEDQVRAAIGNNEETFEIYGDCTLTRDLTVPAGFRLYMQYGTLTVPNGITLTVAQDGHFYSCSNVVAQSGGTIVNNGVLGALSNGDITVEAGGTLENDGYFHLFDGGTFRNYGTYTPGEDSELYFSDGNYKTDVTGVDWKLLTVQSLAQTEEEIRTLIEDSVNVKQLTARLYGTAAVTLSGDLTIPETGCIMLAGESSLTVPQGKTLTNNGAIRLIENTRLVIESGAKLINNDYIGSTEETVVSVAGTLESTGWGYVHIDSWHCTGTFVNGGKGIALFEWAATEKELEAALQSGANTVEVTANITLGSSAAVPEVQSYSLASFASVYADTSAVNGSLIIPEGVNLVIQENVELTVPAEYTLTCLGQISVLGTLNVDGTYSGGQVLVYEGGTVTSEEEIPQQNEGVLVTNITVTGDDTVLPGGSAEYTAEILPENAWVQQVEWSITAGKELAEIDAGGVLFANGTPGTVTICATAADGSEVYGEKTVTIEGASIEEQLRAAIASGDTQFDITGSFTLSDDLTIPAGFNLYVDRGTLTIPNGVTLTIDLEGFFGSCTNTVVQSGGKIVNNGTINSYMGGSITVEAGGTLENNWDFFVFSEGSFHNYGTYTPGADGDLYFDLNGSDLDADLTGVDLQQVTLETRTETEADIRALFAKVGTVKSVRGAVADTSITLTDDLTIPAGCYLHIAQDGVLTVPAGKTLTNNGSINMYSNGRLVIESGAALVNNNDFSAWGDTQVSVAGTFENNGWARANIGGWNCTGELVDNNGSFTLSAEVTTAAELEAAIKAGATYVEVTGDLALDRSITIPENVTLYIDPNVTLTVPSSYTLTNNGGIYVDGTLDVSGTYVGEKVMVYRDGTVTGENIPQRNEGVLAEKITITGAATVSAGGTAQYTAEILPENAWIMWADWSIVSGGNLAEIYPGGYLEAGNTPGEITIRADAADGSLAYAELTVTITDRIPGDINGDGAVNGKDVAALRRYLAGWDVEINVQAADVNGDGALNGKDVALLRRYLAGWDVEIN